MFDLSGRRALVTGSREGLGFAIATGLAQAGASVVLNGRNEVALRKVQREFTEQGWQAEYAAFDVTDPAARDRALSALEPVDILVNNVGLRDRRGLFAFDEKDMDVMLNANVTAPFALSRLVAPHMIKQHWGRIINITSVAGPLSRSGDATYTAAKGGLAALTRALAAELGMRGVTVNAIAPGYFATAPNAKMVADGAVSDWLQQRTSLGRWAQPDEIAGPAVFLASDEAGYVTGHVLAVDGGMLAHF
jgi:gluconate 5-dehydrogenase